MIAVCFDGDVDAASGRGDDSLADDRCSDNYVGWINIAALF